MRRCIFCHRVMDIISGRGALTTTVYECQACGHQWCFGIHKLPDPDRLRREAEELEELADEIEADTGLAGRIRAGLEA